MTTPDTTEARALMAGATEGPWEVMVSDSGHSKYEFDVCVITVDMGDEIFGMDALARLGNERHGMDDGHADAALIVHAVNHLPEYVEAVEAVERVRELHRPIKSTKDDEWDADTMIRGRTYCAACSDSEFDWPVEYKDCPTIRALDGAE